MFRKRLEEILRTYEPGIDPTSFPDDVLLDSIEEMIVGKQQVIDEQHRVLEYFREKHKLTEREMINLNDHLNPL